MKKMKKMNKITNIILFLVLLCISGKVYAGARFAEKYPSNDGIDRFFNGKITSIEWSSRYQGYGQWYNAVGGFQLKYLQNGLSVIEGDYTTIIYNEYFNENILTGFKLNENTTIIRFGMPGFSISYKYNIFYEPNLTLY